MNSDNQDKNLNSSDKEVNDVYGEAFVPEDLPNQKGVVLRISMILFFCLVILGVGAMHLLADDKDFSDRENRVLAEMPKLSVSSIVDGSFMSSFEAYLTDQFPFRDKLISLKTLTDRVVGKTEENGVYIGKDGFLFESQSEYDKEKVKEITDAVLAFSKNNKNLKKAFLLMPNSGYVYSDKLPDYLKLPRQGTQIKRINKALGADESIALLETYKILKRNADGEHLLYYKTDHHWTTRGAYLIFTKLAKIWNLATEPLEFYTDTSSDSPYEFYTVSTTFQGTLSSTAGVHDRADKIEICQPQKAQGTYVVNFESESQKTASLFFSDKLKQKNQYEVFLGGNYDKVIITTVSASDNTLLLIKDSYANCMIPMLTPYFNKIVVIDPRYLTDSLDKIIKENDFSHVLFLYNLNTLLEDNSLVPCLES